ncbi:polysaccharide deacetylase family sporulation protein PdaB [Calidifontibacillus erzurumensis]|uniref:Polysaccharide deacetylase family sporulation protein PdaB n=1 Tax=Calidifontibacillus erzurumensis TaxID=2741433 RepID=A0A8J8GG64_9BACI|nr:polysaccharide deacetylase family sporulation protein PdaB [Calidifontibacillus erzurumensis]NSL52541.1 polysaccharide deacetylase family sporulation protein PdaB [Calidifontibacillus erzurumensis]
MSFYVINGKKVKQSLIVVIAAFFAALVLYMGNLQTAVFSTKEGPMAIYKGEKAGKKIALTFDINWGDEQAEKILDVLKNEGVKNTTFFISASWAERHPQIVERIIKEGHEIGSLGYHYRNYVDGDEKKIRRDILMAGETFKKLGVKDVKYFRTPNGNFNKKILRIADAYGYSIVHYSVDSKDYTNPGVDKIVENVVPAVSGGDIVLLHASDSALQTEKALPLIIKGLKAKSLKSVTIDELISNADIRTSEIK